MRTAIAVFLGILVGGVGATCRAQSQRGLPDPSLPAPVGVNIHFTGEPRAELDMIRDAGFRLARMHLFWSQVERRRGVSSTTETLSTTTSQGKPSRHAAPKVGRRTPGSVRRRWRISAVSE
jgi:hypothetical protein